MIHRFLIIVSLLAIHAKSFEPPRVYPSFVLRTLLTVDYETTSIIPNTNPVTLAKHGSLMAVHYSDLEYSLYAPLDNIHSSYVTSQWASPTLGIQTYNCTFFPPPNKPESGFSFGSFWAVSVFTKAPRDQWVYSGTIHDAKGKASGVLWSFTGSSTTVTIQLDAKNIYPKKIVVQKHVPRPKTWTYQVLSFELNRDHAFNMTNLPFNKSDCTIDPGYKGLVTTNPDLNTAARRDLKASLNDVKLLGWDQAARFYDALSTGVTNFRDALMKTSNFSSLGVNLEEALATLYPHGNFNYTPGPIDARKYLGGFSIRNLLTPAVKDQGSCGSCYAQATATVIELAYFLKLYYARKNNQTSTSLTYPLLSSQYIMDCTPSTNFIVFGLTPNGCFGSFPAVTLEFIVQSGGGIPLVADHPYAGVNGKCKNKGPMVSTGLQSFSFPRNIFEMKNALVNYGPIAVLIDSAPLTTTAFPLNPSWIFEGCYNRTLSARDHVVTVTGWRDCYRASTNSIFPCWEVQNSWSSNWGDAGYFYLPIDLSADCGVLGQALPMPPVPNVPPEFLKLLGDLVEYTNRAVPIVAFSNV